LIFDAHLFLLLAVAAGGFALLAGPGVADEWPDPGGTDFRGGVELVFKFDFKEQDASKRKELLARSLAVIKERVAHYGLKAVALHPVGPTGFSLKLAAKDKKEVGSLKELLAQSGRLEFHITVEPGASQNYEAYWKRFQDALAKGVPSPVARRIAPKELSPGDRVRFPLGLRWYPLSDKAKAASIAKRTPPRKNGAPAPWILCRIDNYDITGKALYNVNHAPAQNRVGRGWVVFFRVKKRYQAAFAKLTRFEEDKYMAIILNDQVDSAPVLRSTLSDSGEISGSFTKKEARLLAAALTAGALPAKPELVSERAIPPAPSGSH